MKLKKRLNSKAINAYLAGPFIGELTWELLRFAPYIIHLKKNMPETILVVFTRPFRFDLYGQYADILVPLKLPFDNEEKQHCFTFRDLSYKNYDNLVSALSNKYKNKYNIIRHIYPHIKYFYSKVKWQFPRGEMDYDFRPRMENVRIIDNYVNTDSVVFVNFNFSEGINLVSHLESKNCFPVFANMFSETILLEKKLGCSFLGCLIELLKRCKFVITKFNSYVANLSLLVGTPVISIGETPSKDSISLINPMNTMVIDCNDAIDGIDIYFEGNKNDFM